MASLGSLLPVNEVFGEESARHGLKGVMGVAAFGSVFRVLLPVQRSRLEEICSGGLPNLMRGGSVISIAYAYPEYAIDAIAQRSGDGYDKESWNVYARWYRHLNRALNPTAKRLAKETEGTAIPAISEGGRGRGQPCRGILRDDHLPQGRR